MEHGGSALKRSPDWIDVKAIRARLKLTREEFAGIFGFPVQLVRGWETGKSKPAPGAHAYLAVIDADPDAVRAALASTLTGKPVSQQRSDAGAVPAPYRL